MKSIQLWYVLFFLTLRVVYGLGENLEEGVSLVVVAGEEEETPRVKQPEPLPTTRMTDRKLSQYAFVKRGDRALKHKGHYKMSHWRGSSKMSKNSRMKSKANVQTMMSSKHESRSRHKRSKGKTFRASTVSLWIPFKLEFTFPKNALRKRYAPAVVKDLDYPLTRFTNQDLASRLPGFVRVRLDTLSFAFSDDRLTVRYRARVHV